MLFLQKKYYRFEFACWISHNSPQIWLFYPSHSLWTFRVTVCLQSTVSPLQTDNKIASMWWSSKKIWKIKQIFVGFPTIFPPIWLFYPTQIFEILEWLFAANWQFPHLKPTPRFRVGDAPPKMFSKLSRLFHSFP